MGNLELQFRPRPLYACLSAALVLAVPGPAPATVISTPALSLALSRAQGGMASAVLGSVVTTCDDSADPFGTTLRALVAVAEQNEIIDVSNCSSIALTMGAIYVPNVFMALLGPSDGALTIYANGGDRAFYSASPELYIENLTISGGVVAGLGAKGGSIYARHDVVLQNSTVTGGKAGIAGGCIYASGKVTMNHSVVTDCSADVYAYQNTKTKALGGAIDAASVTLENASLVANSVARGSHQIDGNYHSEFGGGIRANTFTCSDSTIKGNSAKYGGGISSHAISLTRCTVDTNLGSGIEFIDDGSGAGSAEIVESTISGNTLAGVAGFGNTTLVASTVAMNGYHGFALRGLGLSLSAQSSIIARNSSSDVRMLDGGVLSGANNLVMTTNVIVDPGVITLTADPQLAPLADHGGPTRTHALLATSPAINNGNNAALLAADQRGDGFARESPAGSPDIGAYERQANDDELFYSGFD